MKINLLTAVMPLLILTLTLAGCGYDTRTSGNERETAAENVTAADLRNVRWGMTAAEVMSAEDSEPLLVTDEQIIYTCPDIAGQMAELSYFFDDDSRLWQAEYTFTERHADKELYMSCHKEISRAVTEKYGSPAAESSYENGRQYEYASVWETENTRITLTLYTGGDPVSLKLLYSAENYERTEKNLSEGL